MRTLLATVAVGALIGTAAIAQDAADTAIYSISEGDHYASSLLGSRLYTTEGDLGAEVDYASVSAAWNDVGEINDIVLSEDGSVRAVIVGVGGFLGIGEKDVAISWEDVRPTYDEGGARFLVVTMSQEALESAPAFEHEDPEAMATEATAPAGAEAGMAEGEVVTEEVQVTEEAQAEPVAEDAPAAETDVAGVEVAGEMPATDPVAPAGLQLVQADAVTADELEGASVRSSVDEEWVGDVGHLILDDQGAVSQVVVDVGGFLGIGEKPVAMNFDQLEIYRQGEDGPLEIRVNATRDELDAAPAYEG